MTFEEPTLWDLPPAEEPEEQPPADELDEDEDELLAQLAALEDEAPVAYVSPLKPSAVSDTPPPPPQRASRFVDVNTLLERQAAAEEAVDPGPVAGQVTLFGDDEDFHLAWQEWRGMPEYVSDNLQPWKSVLVHFQTKEDYRAFAEAVGQKWMSNKTRSIWYPEAEWARERGVARYADTRSAAEDEELAT